MSTVITMSQTVNELTSGQVFVVRSREAEALIAASKATKSASKVSAVPTAKVGKRGN